MRTIRIIAMAALLMGITATQAQAQSIKDILSGVVDAVTGKSNVSETSIAGTWKYSSPDCQFESDNLLAQAGGSLASSKINKQLSSVYSKVGMSGLTFTFDSDGNYTSTIKGHTTKGTYTLDSSAKTITLKTTTGITLKAHVSLTSSSLSLLFESDKLMDGLKTVTSLASKVNSTASTVSSILGNYDGLRLGFKMKKK